jgi:hypothetical protein
MKSESEFLKIPAHAEAEEVEDPSVLHLIQLDKGGAQSTSLCQLIDD